MNRTAHPPVWLPVAPAGWPPIALFVAVALLGTALLPSPLWSLPLWVLALWCVWFFRDPPRQTPADPGLIIAPADGRVIVIDECSDPVSQAPVRKVSIFMNVFNVHVNRAPESGQVLGVERHDGCFFNAALDKASLENERVTVHMQTSSGRRLTFVQVAGLVARRIVCPLQPGDVLTRGERFGLIRFGSRVDVYLPREAQVRVTLGQQTRAGETVLAQWPADAGGAG
ncbi:MAG: phosphatidylserine decarboxylase [Magnetococcus sp. WYHC-3]